MHDSHTHLNSDQLYPDRVSHLQDFVDAGWAGLVNIWVHHERNLRAIEIAKNNTTDCIVWAALGIHPGEISYSHTITSSQDIQTQLSQLRELFETHKNNQHILALWECGIDAHYDWDEGIQRLQIELFAAQCELARELQLPIVIHSRDDFDLTLEVLKNYTDLKIYFHCRGYTADDICTAVDTLPHLWVWFCGNITYPKANQLRESLDKAVELWVQILLETDAPYLSPQVVRWTQNTPSNVKHIYERAMAQHPARDRYAYCKKTFYALYCIA